MLSYELIKILDFTLIPISNTSNLKSWSHLIHNSTFITRNF